MDCQVRPGSRAGEWEWALLPLDRRIHGDVGAPFVCKPLANLEVLALDRHFCLALELGGPMAEIIAVPWRLRCERRQPEPLPDRPGPFHELALRQRNWRIDAFERGI